tara:strand:+ start:156 stop:614 length:459 start_codon:yes stop_codon:yes gene_type:complete
VNKIFEEIKLDKIKEIEINKFNYIFFLYINEILNKKNIKKNFFTHLMSKGVKIFFIKQNNFIVGFFTLYLNKFTKISSNNIYLRDFYIKKKYRKKKLGSQVIEKITKIYKKKQFFSIKIEILKSNSRIKNFWERLQFKKNKSIYIKKINDRN